jgi:hypothetical protein
MEAGDLLWVISFSCLLILLHFVNFLIVSSLKGKALGSQSTLDLASIDTFFVLKCYGTIVCVMCMLGRFAYFQMLLTNIQVLLTLCCSLYIFILICMCVNAGCICIIRTLCVQNMALISETIEDCRVRWISASISFFCGFFASLICSLGQDVESGSQLALLTNKVKHSGEYIMLISNNF